MTWPAVILLAVVYLAAILKIAQWLGGLLSDAGLFESSDAGKCTCTRHRLCPACLEYLRPKAEREAA